MSRPLYVLVLVLLGAALLIPVACAGPTFIVQQYSGPQRPPETIATLRVNGGGPERLLVLDEQDVAAPIVEDGRLHVEVLPALHTVVVGNALAPSERYLPISFTAQPNKVYRIVFVGAEARVYEVDRATDALVRDVTTPPAVMDVALRHPRRGERPERQTLDPP